MRTLKVQGKGEVSVVPDICIFTLLVAEKRRDYKDCHSALNNKVDQLRNDLIGLDIPPTSIKTTDYSISQVTTYSKQKEKHLPDGYRGQHRLTVEVPLNKDRMNNVFKLLSEDSADPSISISFGVSDTESVRKQLLRNAVTAAKMNAETIADAADINLGEITSIEYGWSEVRLYNEVDYDASCCLSEGQGQYAPDIEANDLYAADTVTIVFEIN